MFGRQSSRRRRSARQSFDDHTRQDTRDKKRPRTDVNWERQKALRENSVEVVFAFLCVDNIPCHAAWTRFFDLDTEHKFAAIAHFKTPKYKDKFVEANQNTGGWLNHAFGGAVKTGWGTTGAVNAEMFLYVEASKQYPASKGIVFLSGCCAPLLDAKQTLAVIIQKSGNHRKVCAQQLTDGRMDLVPEVELIPLMANKYIPRTVALKYVEWFNKNEEPLSALKRKYSDTSEAMHHAVMDVGLDEVALPLFLHMSRLQNATQHGHLVHLDPHTSRDQGDMQYSYEPDQILHTDVQQWFIGTPIKTAQHMLMCLANDGIIAMRHVTTEMAQQMCLPIDSHDLLPCGSEFNLPRLPRLGLTTPFWLPEEIDGHV